MGRPPHTSTAKKRSCRKANTTATVFSKKKKQHPQIRGTWLFQWVEHLTPDLRVITSSPRLGTELTLKKTTTTTQKTVINIYNHIDKEANTKRKVWEDTGHKASWKQGLPLQRGPGPGWGFREARALPLLSELLQTHMCVPTLPLSMGSFIFRLFEDDS